MAIAAVLLFLPVSADRALGAPGSDWPGFRGPNVDGVSTETHVLESEGARLEIAWKRPLGSGYSSVSVSDGRVVATFSDGKSDVVAAFNAADGKEQWRVPLDETYKGHDGSKDGPLSTPLIADGRVFVIAPRGKFVALDAANGKEIWKTDLVKDHNAIAPHYGFSTSPLFAGGAVIVQIGAKEAMVAGFDLQSGKRLWAAGDDGVEYQSPIPWSMDGRALVLATGKKKLVCLDPKSGEIVWEHAHGGKGERGPGCLVPVPVDSTRIFLKYQDDRSTVVEVARRDDQSVLHTVWEDRNIGKTYSVPVRHDGLIYGFNGLTLACVDAGTGKTAWRSRDPGDGFPIIVDNHLIVAAKAGGIYVAKTGGDEYHQIAGVKVFDDLIWAPPSFSHGAIYVRSMDGIARINIRPGAALTEARREPDRDIAGTRFGKLVDGLASAAEKPAAIDKFIASVEQFPIIEPDGRVIFIYRGPGQQIVLGGDLTGYGEKLALKRVADSDLFYGVARLEPDARIGYAFVRDFKVITDPLNPRTFATTGLDDDLEMTFSDAKTEVSWLAMPGWKPPTHFDPPSESRRGRIEPQKFKSTVLNAEIEIDVYTPAGYQSGGEPLPVAYVHGGKEARDEMHLPDALDNLMGSRISPFIAVFIKRRPPVFHAAPDDYAKMAGEELPAFIDGKYKTIRTRAGRAHIASGWGGFAAMYTVLAHADRAAKLGVQSAFMLNVEPIEPVMKDASKSPITVYLDWGKYDARDKVEGWSVPRAGRELDQFFRDHGYKPAGGEAHDGAGLESWKNRTDDLLEALFPLKQRG